MFTSERFLGRIAKLRKQHREATVEEQVDLVRGAFTSMLAGLPGGMAEDVYESISEKLQGRMEPDAVYLDAAKYLSDVADLFALQYDDKADPIVAEDWGLIGEIVNDFALDLEMELVNYVMSRVVDHHGLDDLDRG